MNRDNHLIFEAYALFREGLESKMQHLVKLVPDNVEDKQKYVQDVADQYDPSNEKIYIQWILKMMQAGNIRGDEDKEDVRKMLEKFSEAKLRKKLQGNEADINFYKSPGQLSRHMAEKIGEKMTKKEQLQIGEKQGIKKIAEQGGMQLYAITTPEAANKHLQQTGWCVKHPSYWEGYAKGENRTEIHYLIVKPDEQTISTDGRVYDKRKYRLVNFATKQYMNTFNEPEDPSMQEINLFLSARDFLEKHEPENLGSIYASFFVQTGQEIPENVIESIMNKRGSSDASDLYNLMYLGK